MKNLSVSGVGGWLALLIIGMTILGPLFSCSEISTTFRETETLYPILTSFSTWSNYKLIIWTIVACSIALSFSAGYRLWKINTQKSVQFAIITLWIVNPFKILLYGLTFILIFGTWSYDITFILAGDFIKAVIVSIVWTLYLKKSARVKNTYIKELFSDTKKNIDNIQINKKPHLRKRKLNGWKRIYICICVVNFITCTIFFGYNFIENGIYHHTFYDITRLENELIKRGVSISEIKESAERWNNLQTANWKEWKKMEQQESKDSFQPPHRLLNTPIAYSGSKYHGLKDYIFYYIKKELNIDPDEYIEVNEETGISDKGEETLMLFPIFSIIVPVLLYISIILIHRICFWVLIGFKE